MDGVGGGTPLFIIPVSSIIPVFTLLKNAYVK